MECGTIREQNHCFCKMGEIYDYKRRFKGKQYSAAVYYG